MADDESWVELAAENECLRADLDGLAAENVRLAADEDRRSSRDVMTALMEEIEERYGEDRGISGIWSNYVDEQTPHWSIDRQFYPLRWGFGIDVQREPGGPGPNWPASLTISADLGPWCFYARREWKRAA